jgi:hypothetical protein
MYKVVEDTTYTFTSNPNIIHRDIDHANIPNDPTNVDYQIYQDWLNAGNTPNPAPLPDKGQETNALLAGGLAITFTSDQANSATYPTIDQYRINLNSITSYLNLNGNFPGNQSTVIIKDVNNNSHNFTNKTFPKLTTAIGDFVHGCNLYAQGETSSLPPNSVTVA